MTKINAEITITAFYEDAINIIISDKDAGTRFIDMTLTREQFINAAMNRLSSVKVKEADVFNLDIVGKKQEYKKFEFEIPDLSNRDNEEKWAIGNVEKFVPVGWKPDKEFNSQDSFFSIGEKHYARTMIRRWVEKS